MRFRLVMHLVAALLSFMCADMNGIRASAQNRDGSLIERTTQDRKPRLSAASSTVHQETKAESVLSVGRIPLSKVRVEAGSRQPDSPVAAMQKATMKEATMQKTDDVAPLLVIAKPEEVDADPLFAVDEIEILAPIRPAKPIAPQATVTSDVTAPRQLVPTVTPIPEIKFDPMYDEHTIRLPDTTNDGFVGVPRSQQGKVSQSASKQGHYHNNKSTDHQTRPEQQQRVFPKLFRRR